MDELLIRLDERTQAIDGKVDDLIASASNGGWNRCHENNRRLQALEQIQSTREERRKWVDRAVVVTLATLVIHSVWDSKVAAVLATILQQ